MLQETKRIFIVHIPWYLKALFFFQRKKCWVLENGILIWYNEFRDKLYLVEVLSDHTSRD